MKKESRKQRTEMKKESKKQRTEMKKGNIYRPSIISRRCPGHRTLYLSNAMFMVLIIYYLKKVKHLNLFRFLEFKDNLKSISIDSIFFRLFFASSH